MRIPALLLCCILLAPHAPPAHAATPVVAAHDDLQAMDARWNAMRLASDADGLAALLADDFVLTHSDGKVQRKADYVADLRTGTRRNHAIDNFDVLVQRHGDTAVVTGRTVQRGTGADGPFSGAFRFTRVWVLRDGAWLLVASHSSRLAD